ncbi:hypothetical protein BJ170DRAFT_695174 [Xylariales sp. AK1849]|nr:hypothetical protein BJ170DRAFT_695174 [Xylariales sp. AK1849]
MPPKRIFDVTGEQADMAAMTKDIFENVHRLRRVLTTHSRVIRKRWEKLRPGARTKRLQKFDLDMPKEHLPDLKDFRSTTPKHTPRWYMWPHINIEDLTADARPMLQFLLSRGTMAPGFFLPAEVERAHTGRYAFKKGTNERILPVDRSGEQHMLIHAGYEAAGYGVITTEVVDASVLLGHGLLGLKIQRGIYRFLMEFVSEILQDVDIRELLSLPSPPTSPDTWDLDLGLVDPDVRVSLAQMKLERPYRATCDFSIHRFRQLSEFGSAHATEAKNTLIRMKEDPEYFQSMIFDTMDHSPSKIAPVDRRKEKETEAWLTAIKLTVTSISNEIVRWSILSEKIEKLAEKLAQHSPIDIMVQRIGDEIRKDIHYIGQLLQCQMREDLLPEIKYLAPASEKLRGNYYRGLEIDPTRPSVEWKLCQETTLTVEKRLTTNKTLTRAMTMIGDLTNNGILAPDNAEGEARWVKSIQGQIYFGTLFDEFEWFLENDKDFSKFISGTIKEKIQNFALLEYIRDEIGEIPLPALEDDVRQRILKQIYTRMAEFSSIYSPELWEGIAELALPKSSRKAFSYPVGSKASKKQEQDAKEAEAQLKTFWDAFEARYLQLEYESKLILDLLSEATPMSLERILKPGPASELPTALSPRPNVSVFTAPFGQLSLGHQEDRPMTGRSLLDPDAKEKEKTRGEADPPEEGDDSSSSSSGGQAKVMVDAVALDVFQFLFRGSGERRWDDFLKAMVSINFAVNHPYGSAWMFKPQTPLPPNGSTRSILIHMPHPSIRLDTFHARNIGHRFRREYGWHFDVFELNP